MVVAKMSKLKEIRRRPDEQSDQVKRPAAFSYHASRSTRETNVGREREAASEQRQKSLKQPIKLKRQALIVAAVLLVFVAIVSLFQNPSPSIVVTGSSTSRLSLKELSVYKAAATSSLHKSFWSWLKPTVNTAAIDSDIKSQFPELSVAGLRVSMLGFQPKLVIEAYEPSMIVLGNGGSYVIDETGTALFPSSQLDSATRNGLPLLTDNSGLLITAGTDVLPQDDMLYIRQVLAYLKASSIVWQDLTLPVAANELDVRVNDGYYIKFATKGGVAARQQVGSFLAVRQKLGNDKPKEYIDVRVPERAYYK